MFEPNFITGLVGCVEFEIRGGNDHRIGLLPIQLTEPAEQMISGSISNQSNRPCMLSITNLSEW